MKQKLFTMKVTAEQLDRYHNLARAKGRSLSEIIRAYLDGEPLPDRPPRKIATHRPPPPVDPELIRQVAAIGNNLNQIGRSVNRAVIENERISVLSSLSAIEQQLELLLDEAKK